MCKADPAIVRQSTRSAGFVLPILSDNNLNLANEPPEHHNPLSKVLGRGRPDTSPHSAREQGNCTTDSLTALKWPANLSVTHSVIRGFVGAKAAASRISGDVLFNKVNASSNEPTTRVSESIMDILEKLVKLKAYNFVSLWPLR